MEGALIVIIIVLAIIVTLLVQLVIQAKTIADLEVALAAQSEALAKATAQLERLQGGGGSKS